MGNVSEMTYFVLSLIQKPQLVSVSHLHLYLFSFIGKEMLLPLSDASMVCGE